MFHTRLIRELSVSKRKRKKKKEKWSPINYCWTCFHSSTKLTLKILNKPNSQQSNPKAIFKLIIKVLGRLPKPTPRRVKVNFPSRSCFTHSKRMLPWGKKTCVTIKLRKRGWSPFHCPGPAGDGYGNQTLLPGSQYRPTFLFGRSVSHTLRTKPDSLYFSWRWWCSRLLNCCLHSSNWFSI